jgi:hypothetical protein
VARAVTVVLNHVPAGQSLQAPAPPVLYWPTGQGTAEALVDPAGHAYPALQAAVHVLVRAVSLLHVPAEQLMHAAAPSLLYRPAGHATAVAFVDPAGQK